jgi:hypothetical protein
VLDEDAIDIESGERRFRTSVVGKIGDDSSDAGGKDADMGEVRIFSCSIPSPSSSASSSVIP